jgi:hypothetical protein
MRRHLFSAKSRILLAISASSMLVFLTACGGGGGTANANNASITCTINCDAVDPNSYLGAYAAGGDGGGGGDGGAGGGAGDGAAIVNAPITLTDARGVVRTSTTGADGKFFFTVTGMKAPLVVQVTKPDGSVRMSFTRVEPTIGKTISISVSGLSDKIASDVVISINGAASGSKGLTPTMVVQAASTIPRLINALNTSIASVLTANGLDAKTFDPMAAVLVPAAAGATQNSYDKVLDALAITPGTTGTPTVILAPLEAAKALFKNLRNTVGAYSNTANTGDLDVADKKLKDAAKAVISPVDNDTLRILGGFFKAESMYSQYKSGASTTAAMTYGSTQFGQITTKDVFGVATPFSSMPSYGCDIRKISLLTNGAIDVANTRVLNSYTIGGTQVSPITTPALATSAANGFVCYGIGTQGRLIGTLLDDGLVRVNSIYFMPQSNGSYNIISQTGKSSPDKTGQFSTATGSPASALIDGTVKFGTLTPVRDTAGNITSFTITGDLRPGFATMKDRTLATWQSFAGYGVNLTMAETSTTTTKTQTLSGSVALNKADGTVASTATIGSGSTLTETSNVVTGTNIQFYGSNSCPAGSAQVSGTASPNIQCSFNKYTNLLSSGTLNVAIAAPGIKFEGVVTAANPSEDKIGTANTSMTLNYKPTALTFTGKLYDTDTVGAYRLLFDGALSATNPNWSTFNSTIPESSTNFLLSTASFDGKLYLVNRPVVNLVMAFTKTGYQTGTTSGSFKWSDASGFPAGFTITGAYNDVAGTGSMAFKSTDVNATFTLPKGGSATKQKIYVNSVEQGSITISTKKVEYIDGTFEQF